MQNPRIILALLFALIVAPLTAANAEQAPNTLSEAEIADGWLLLFDGETTFGWKAEGNIDWTVDKGVIRATKGDVGLLRTTTQFANYELHVEFRAPAETNSGIFLRTSPKPESPTYGCYELNIAPESNSFPTGSLVGRMKVTPGCSPNEWHAFDVTADQGTIVVKLDGTEVLKYEDPQYVGLGFIGLQHNQGEVEFRNVKLKPLHMESIFNGKDLAGWKSYPEMESKFTVTEAGEIHAENGPGQLETENSYGDFVLRLEAITHAKNLNSGVFFRCIPGDKMMGYESQIHNGYEAEDRTLPIDHGTGAIFRRVKARRVVSDDEKWFTKTLIAQGPHISVWVNGYQVTDWTDQRKPDENPRRGLRTAPGTIMLQGHDPTTNLSFKNLQITELPKRWPADRKAKTADQ
ncbi:DUF1080 domain-containing protein [Blastopirellula sp. JC732]|uniref:DUF1080 domain-containing protein n=1 Tax=Blastopirellula sediminis TaxID=2894196 RepID=A0A9X1SJ93_9BACT|nr:DUF1080 domain-containing protein [Blastopirellula sediminis]MCC9605039.1 DUF1080 domain-containing protein [Blastopirellula sediminis]MCC9631661.1 DUF1080 domain-containing protein [Blastopirellula sediminis]